MSNWPSSENPTAPESQGQRSRGRRIARAAVFAGALTGAAVSGALFGLRHNSAPNPTAETANPALLALGGHRFAPDLNTLQIANNKQDHKVTVRIGVPLTAAAKQYEANNLDNPGGILDWNNAPAVASAVVQAGANPQNPDTYLPGFNNTAAPGNPDSIETAIQTNVFTDPTSGEDTISMTFQYNPDTPVGTTVALGLGEQAWIQGGEQVSAFQSLCAITKVGDVWVQGFNNPDAPVPDMGQLPPQVKMLGGNHASALPTFVSRSS